MSTRHIFFKSMQRCLSTAQKIWAKNNWLLLWNQVHQGVRAAQLALLHTQSKVNQIKVLQHYISNFRLALILTVGYSVTLDMKTVCTGEYLYHRAPHFQWLISKFSQITLWLERFCNDPGRTSTRLQWWL